MKQYLVINLLCNTISYIYIYIYIVRCRVTCLIKNKAKFVIPSLDNAKFILKNLKLKLHTRELY